MKKGFIQILIAAVVGGLIVAATGAYLFTHEQKTGGFPFQLGGDTKTLGAAAGTGRFPTSTNNFQDHDTINAGDWNALESWMGVRTSTSSSTLRGLIANLSSTVSGSISLPSSTWTKVANNLSDLASTSSARTNLGYTGGNKISISATGTIGLTTSSISQFTNDAGYVTTSTGSGNVVATGTTNNFTYFTGTHALASSSNMKVDSLGNIYVGSAYTFDASPGAEAPFAIQNYLRAFNALDIGSTFLGYWAGGSSTAINLNATYNAALGAFTLDHITVGSQNAAFGAFALQAVTSGTSNFGGGTSAGLNLKTGGSNVLIGASVASTLVTGSSNIIIGANVNVPASSTSNYINIGNVFIASGSAASVSGTLALAISGTQCIHAVSGILTGTGADCGSGSGSSSSLKFASWTVAPSGGDFTTIQGALDACGTAGGGFIYVVGGTFSQGATGLRWKGSNCAIWGQNGSTTLTFTGATTYFKTNAAASAYSHNELHNVIISGDGNTSSVGIDMSDMSHSKYDNIIMDNVGTAFAMHDTQDVTFYNIVDNFDVTTLQKFGIDGSSTEPWNANTFSHGFIGCAAVINCVGIRIGNGEHNTFQDVAVEPDISAGVKAGTIGVQLYDQNVGTNPGTFGNVFNNLYIEGNNTCISIAASVSSGEGVAGNTFNGGICDTNGTIIAPTSTETTFINFNGDFNPFTVLGGHVGIAGGQTSPTVSSCGSGASVNGDDNHGKISTGSTGVSSCALTFALSWNSAPICTVSGNVATNTPSISSITTSVLTIITSSTVTSKTFWYQCTGLPN